MDNFAESPFFLLLKNCAENRSMPDTATLAVCYEAFVKELHSSELHTSLLLVRYRRLNHMIVELDSLMEVMTVRGAGEKRAYPNLHEQDQIVARRRITDSRTYCP